MGNGSLFIESPRFPVDAVNIASAREKRGGGRPDYWEMVFWWTKKPLADARAVIAASALSHDIDPSGFRVALRLDEGVAHRKNPARIAGWAERFAGMRLLDPFAGFGST